MADVTLPDLVQAYAERTHARSAREIARSVDDHSDIVGEERAREVRRDFIRAADRARDAEIRLEALLEQAYLEALAR